MVRFKLNFCLNSNDFMLFVAFLTAPQILFFLVLSCSLPYSNSLNNSLLKYSQLSVQIMHFIVKYLTKCSTPLYFKTTFLIIQTCYSCKKDESTKISKFIKNWCCFSHKNEKPTYFSYGRPGSSVGIATDYGLDGPGIVSLLAVVEREGCAVKKCQPACSE